VQNKGIFVVIRDSKKPPEQAKVLLKAFEAANLDPKYYEAPAQTQPVALWIGRE
jgi:hypothetical protein